MRRPTRPGRTGGWGFAGVTAVVARDLEKRFGSTIGLDRIDLDIPTGSTMAILGPNGAGKSTLLRLIAGLARPSSGSLEVGGESAHHRTARARVGFIGHATGLYPELTARENLIFAARLRGVANSGARVEEQLVEAGLTRAADRRTGGFSRAYLHHLFASNEVLSAILASIHNTHFYQRLVQGAREAILARQYHDFRRDFLERYQS